LEISVSISGEREEEELEEEEEERRANSAARVDEAEGSSDIPKQRGSRDRFARRDSSVGTGMRSDASVA
jgi:hypothetical protein